MPTLPTPVLLSVALGTGQATSGGNHARVLIELDFDAVTYPGVTFFLQLDTGSGFGSGIPFSTADIYKDDLALSTAYSWRIAANLSGYTASPYLTGTFTTAAVPAAGSDLAAPTSLVASNVPGTPGSFNLFWTPAGARLSYYTVVLTCTGETTRSFNTSGSPLAGNFAGSSLTVAKTWTITITPVCVLTSGTITGSTSLVGTLDVFTASPAWTGPTALFLTLGVPTTAQYSILALTTSFASAIPGLPDGLTATPGTGGKTLLLNGAPTAEGIYGPTVAGSGIDLASASVTYTLPILIGVTGPLCIGWLNDDPRRLDLQLNLRTRLVTSFAQGLTGGGAASLRLTRGDTRRAYLLQRDNAGRLLIPALTEIQFVARLVNHRDGIPLVALRATTVLTETVNGMTVPYIDLTPTSPWLDRIFAALDKNPSAEPAAAALACEAELLLIPASGNPITSEPFPLTIENDYAR